MIRPFVDIHCHLLPHLDDGAKDWKTSLAMAEMAVADGIHTIVATPHQLGSFSGNRGDIIRTQAAELRRRLAKQDIPLQVLAGGDVRIEDGLRRELASGNVLTLGDYGRHVLLELPHELYFPLEPVLAELNKLDMVGVLSHPERNHGLLREPERVLALAAQGCLMQITAGSLTGRFGPASQQLAEWLLDAGVVHVVATDAHGLRSRPPLMQPAFERVIALTDADMADALCCSNPARIARGDDVPLGTRPPRRRQRFVSSWFRKRTAA